MCQKSTVSEYHVLRQNRRKLAVLVQILGQGLEIIGTRGAWEPWVLCPDPLVPAHSPNRSHPDQVHSLALAIPDDNKANQPCES